MRTIKFRAWDLVENEYIYYEPNDAIIFGLMNEQGLIPEQFTGLLDCNGKEIYEGDIVCGYFRYDEDEKVSYVQNAEIDYINGWWRVKKVNFHLCRFKEIIVVGNVHENPELK